MIASQNVNILEKLQNSPQVLFKQKKATQVIVEVKWDLFNERESIWWRQMQINL